MCQFILQKQPPTSTGIQKIHRIRKISKCISQIPKAFISYFPSCINPLLIFPQLFYLLFYHLLACTNRTILMDAILHVTTLCLSVFLMLCVFYSHYTTRQDPKVLGPQRVSNPFIAFPVALRNNQEQISEWMALLLHLFHTPLGSLEEQRQIPVPMDLFLQLPYTSGLILIQNKFQRVWVFTYCLVAHLLGLVLIKNIFQRPWTFFHCLVAYFLGL